MFKWKTLKRKVVYAAKPWMEVSLETVQTERGVVVEDYHQLNIPDFVVVVAETSGRDVVCLRQYKHGIRELALTFPGGTVEPGEDPRVAAERELREETGYQSARWCHLGSFTVHGNLGAGKGHFYRAEGAEQTHQPQSGDLEYMALELKSWTTLCQCMAEGEIKLLNHATAMRLAAPQGMAFLPPASAAAE